jgi:hypothetical protein
VLPRLDWQPIHWTHTQMELRTTLCVSIHAGLHCSRPSTLYASNAPATRACTPRLDGTHLWGAPTICHHRYIPSRGLQRHETHTGIAWHPVILRLCSRLHHDPCYRLYRHSAGQRHQSYYEIHHPAAKLLRHASRCRCPLLCQRHGSLHRK